MPLTVTGRLICPSAEARDALVPAVREHIRLTQAEPGCLGFDIRPDPADATAFLVEEAFVDRPAFDAHQARMQATGWPALTADVVRDLRIAE